MYAIRSYYVVILTQIMSFEGNYIDGLMTRKESIFNLLKAKYYFYSLGVVITSYSIHYTKLYESAKGYGQTPSAVPYNGWLDVSVIHRPELLQLVWGLWIVITSYSIHYTKLYDSGELNSYLMWLHCFYCSLRESFTEAISR